LPQEVATPLCSYAIAYRRIHALSDCVLFQNPFLVRCAVVGLRGGLSNRQFWPSDVAILPKGCGHWSLIRTDRSIGGVWCRDTGRLVSRQEGLFFRGKRASLVEARGSLLSRQEGLRRRGWDVAWALDYLIAGYSKIPV